MQAVSALALSWFVFLCCIFLHCYNRRYVRSAYTSKGALFCAVLQLAYMVYQEQHSEPESDVEIPVPSPKPQGLFKLPAQKKSRAYPKQREQPAYPNYQDDQNMGEQDDGAYLPTDQPGMHAGAMEEPDMSFVVPGADHHSKMSTCLDWHYQKVHIHASQELCVGFC